MKKKEKINILAVDDKKSNLLSLELILKSPNFEIITATSGNEALSLMLEYEFALVLLDVQMPDIDGFETAELMRSNQRTKHIPIIFVTAINTEKKFIFKGYKSGAVDYLAKPLDPDILRSKINVFVELHKQKTDIFKLKEKLGSILKTVPDIIYRLDTEGKIVFISKAIEPYGYETETLVGKYVLDLIHPDDKEKAVYRLNERRTGERNTKSFETRILTPAKAFIPFTYFNISAEGLYQSDKPNASTFIGTQGIARDITDKKQAHEELFNREKLQGVLETAAAVCHELNQPLHSVSGYSQLLTMSMPKDGLLCKKIGKIQKEIDRMGKITGKLMRITTYETKEYASGKKIVDINKSSNQPQMV